MSEVEVCSWAPDVVLLALFRTTRRLLREANVANKVVRHTGKVE